ncbi:hypothetical protein HAX54_036466 [Datura stramonium]|uniref:Uncharacterized protein n=1 Tax=Datura stramonium TaxID=4076 RepID=A0ABS8VI62_DATST|nr:hypothetical protein [Datura stramonium]
MDSSKNCLVSSSTYLVSVLLFFFAVDVASSTAPLRRAANPHWHSASATWYGSPNGDGMMVEHAVTGRWWT